MHAMNSGIEQTARKIRHELNTTEPLKKVHFQVCGMMSHAIPEKFFGS